MTAEPEKDGAECAEEAVAEKSAEKDAVEEAKADKDAGEEDEADKDAGEEDEADKDAGEEAEADKDAGEEAEADKDAAGEAEVEKAPAADGKDTPAQDASPATEGKRRRRPTERMLEEPAVDRKRKQPKLSDGEGVPLGELAVFAAGLKKQDMILLRKLHRVLYNTQGSQKNIRQVLRKFQGFTFRNDGEEQKKLAQIEKHSRTDLNTFCQLVGLSHRKDKHETSVALLEFLKRPSEENSRPKKPVSRPSKKASAPKPSRGRKSESKEDSYYAKFIREERKNIKEQHPDASETELIFLCGAEFGKKYEVVIDEDGESDANEEPEGDAAEEDNGDAEPEAKEGDNDGLDDGDVQEGQDADATAHSEAV